MPRIIEKTVFTFDELSPEAQENARDWYRQGALDYDWWDCCPDDYAVDAKHFYFDLYRGTIDIRFARSAGDTAEYILKNHGEMCDSYQVAKDFTAKLDALDEENDDREELAAEFLHDLGECILSSLRREEEYLTSDEQVDEMILANGYEFDADGGIA